MADVKYTYSISGDFPNGKVATDRLGEEIRESAIVTALSFIATAGDNCDIWFKDALSAGDQTILDGVVAAHSGEPLSAEPEPVTIADARFDSDKKQVVVITPAPKSTFTWYTSRGDVKDPLERGGGDRALIQIAGGTGVPNPQVAKVSFAEDGGIYLHDGEISWRNMSTGDTQGFSGIDEVSIFIEMPGTPAEAVIPNPGGTGNCTLVPYGPGNVIVPAGGAGDYDVDLDKAVPLPDSSGYWITDEKTGDIVPNVGQDRDQYDMKTTLADFGGPNFYLVRRVGMTRIQGVFEIDAYLVEWVSKWWNLCLEIEKNMEHTDDLEVGA